MSAKTSEQLHICDEALQLERGSRQGNSCRFMTRRPLTEQSSNARKQLCCWNVNWTCVVYQKQSDSVGIYLRQRCSEMIPLECNEGIKINVRQTLHNGIWATLQR